MSSPGNFSRRQFVGMALGSVALGPAILRAAAQSPDLEAVCDRMKAIDEWRSKTLLGYSAKRRYTLRLGDHQPAETLVSMEYTSPGKKTFQVISEKDCGFLEQRVLQKVMNAEVQASRGDTVDSTRILPCNYDFAALGSAELEGRPSYVIRMKPKRKERFLVDGKIWVDAEDAAVAHLDGEVAAHSFWVHNFHMVQSYKKVGPYWLVASNWSSAKARVLGEATLNIEYFDYQLRSA